MANLGEVKRDAHRVSGVSNVAYDLVTILQNKDAEEQNDDEVIKLLDDLEHRACEDLARLRQLVARRLQ